SALGFSLTLAPPRYSGGPPGHQEGRLQTVDRIVPGRFHAHQPVAGAGEAEERRPHGPHSRGEVVPVGAGTSVPGAGLPRGGAGGEGLAVPAFDQAGRDGDAVGRQDLSGGEGGVEFVAGEPAGLVDLVAVDLDRGRGGAGDEAEHEAGREGPGLAGEVLDLADVDADLLVDLAAHRLLDGLAGLD